MSKKVKMKPSDYAQFSFRISYNEKIELMNRLEVILDALKENQKEDDYVPKKNALILRALKKGLVQIEKEISKK